jgi:DNA-binding SARP family transcriptional activator/predicted ATPase
MAGRTATQSHEASTDDVLVIRLLGDPDVRIGRRRLEAFDQPRLQALLAYLLLHRDAPQQRAHVAFVLWPDSTESQARTNLRQLLHHLRRALPRPDRFVTADSVTVGWRPDADCWSDLAAFEEAVARADAAATRDAARGALAEAASHYGGDLLPGCYEEWVLPERERLRQRYLDVLERLTDLLEEELDLRGAIHHAQTLLRHDPLHEATYRRLMRLHALAGERARALRVYHTCATTLERELGVPPSEETRESYLALRSAEEEPSGGGAGAVPFVGRRDELKRCVGTYREAMDGRATVLLVRGEAGIGKTRLVEQLGMLCTRQGHAVVRARAYPGEGRLAYAPIVDWLRSDVLRAARRRLDDVWLAELARLLPEVRAEHPDVPSAEPLPAAEQRQRLFQALLRAIHASGGPPVLVLDDLHWADRETLEFLHFLVRADPRAPLLLTVTARPEELAADHPASQLLTAFTSLGALAAVELGPLDRRQVAELAAGMAGGPLDAGRAAALYAATEGNPLFVVETVRAPGSSEQLPPRVQAVIELRLGQLSPAAREIVGLAGLIGREFTYEVLREASGRDEASLVDVLDELWVRRIVGEQGASAYDFTHDRIREVAAGRVAPARARILHLRVAAALAALHADDPDAVSAEVASHYEAAGDHQRALEHYERAAAHAQRLSAIEEAAALYERALTVLDELPESPERDHREVELRTALGVPLVALEGYGGADVRRVYERATALCRTLDRPVSPPIHRGMAIASLTWGEFDAADGHGRALLAAARWDGGHGDGTGAGARGLEVEGHYVLGVTAFWRGDFTGSRDHLTTALDRCQFGDLREHLVMYAQDPEVVCLVRLAYTVWYLGEPELARELRDRALTRAAQVDHPMTSAYALNYAWWVAHERGDQAELRRLAGSLDTLVAEHRLGFFRAMGPILSGWVTAMDEDPEAGAASIREGLATFGAIGQVLHVSYALALLARTCSLSGDTAGASAAVTEALTLTERTGQRYLEAELHRLRGECETLHGRDGAADEAFLRALTVARELGSSALELRAASSLVRHRAGRATAEAVDAAISALERIRGRFKEGERTADLRAADALLDTVAVSV